MNRSIAAALPAMRADRHARPAAVALLRTLVIGLTAFLTVVDLFATQAILPSLVQHYRATPAAMGFAVNASTIGMAISGLAVALFSRRIDRRLGILFSLALLSIPTALLAVAPDLGVFTALRILQGLFMSAAFTLTLAYLGEQCSAKDAAGATAPKDVTDNVLAEIDLSKEMVAANDHLFRMRRLEIQPGGIVPWHSHADRPALIYVVAGEITEYASTCAVPIVHEAGDVSVDAGRSHWWKNTGSKAVVLISADILHDPKEAGMM